MARELIHKAMQLASAGTVQYPRPLHTYDVCDIEDAFRYIQSGRNSGRVVIRVDSSIKVQVCVYRVKIWWFLTRRINMFRNTLCSEKTGHSTKTQHTLLLVDSVELEDV